MEYECPTNQELAGWIDKQVETGIDSGSYINRECYERDDIKTQIDKSCNNTFIYSINPWII
jgi:hypothetical protein